MPATKFSQYQAALRHLGDIRLATITDDVEARYALDDAWDASANFVLRQAAWRFALKHAALAANTADLVFGYTNSYHYPAGWLRTHAVFLYGAGQRECPFDFREFGEKALSANISGAAIVMRYVSDDVVDPDAAAAANSPWPEHFSQVQAAYLAFLVAERVTGERAAAGRMSQLFSSLLPAAAAIDAIPEDPWLPHQRSGTLQRVAHTMIDEDYWRFALKTVQMTSSIAGDGGFLYQVPLPADCSRTRALYVVSQEKGSIGQRRPFDVRERGGAWQTNMPQFYAEYISSTLAMDSTQWPDHYMRALLRQIQYDQANLDETEHSESADRLKTSTDQQQAFAAWKDALAATTDSEAEPPDPWLPHQFSGAFARCLPTVMSKGYWKFALKRLQLNAETDQEAVAPIGDFPYSFALPADWFKTHAIYIPFDGAECPIDVREHEGHWNTATTAFMVRYISTAALDPTQWPDSVADAVEAYLEIDAAKNPAETKDAVDEWGRDLAAALVEWSLPEHPWLRFQLDGRYFETVKAVIGAARWRFATKTVNLTADATMNADGTVTGTPIPTALGDGSISPSYSAVFRKPPDWYRTLWMYRMVTSAPQVDVGYVYREDIDYRDEGGSWHTNWDTIQVRYLSRDGLDSTRWPASFRNAVLAWLRYEETQDPKALKFYEDAIARATEEDDTREKPPVNFRSRFTQARFGNRGYGNSGAGGAGGNTTTILTDENGNALTPG